MIHTVQGESSLMACFKLFTREDNSGLFLLLLRERFNELLRAV